MDVVVDYDKDNMLRFWSMMSERHSIYKKREAGKLPPWTNSKILKEYKFTNVFRELDNGTRFVTDYIIPRTDNISDLIFHIMLYRMFNKIESVHAVLNHPSYKFSLEAFDQTQLEFLMRSYIEDTGDGVWTNAFIVSGFSHLPKGWDKISRVCHILNNLKESLINLKTSGDMQKTFSTLESTYDWMLKQEGYGSFLGYQCAIDVSYIPRIPFGEDDFVVCGPGCKRGLDRLFPQEIIDHVGYEGLNMWLRDEQYSFYEECGIDYKTLLNDRKYPYLTVMSIENLLCEFSKYMKVYNEEGRPRNKHDSTQSAKRKASNKYSTWLVNKAPFNVYSKINMNETIWSEQ